MTQKDIVGLKCGGCRYNQMRLPRKATLAETLLLTLGVHLCFGLAALAQTSDSGRSEEPDGSWTSVTDLSDDHLNPTRVVQHHSHSGHRTLDIRSVEIRISDGRFEPYQDIETETIEVDASTERTTTRMFGRDVNGSKSLVQVIEEDKHLLSAGGSHVVRVTSSPDLNGSLRQAQKEIVETKRLGPDVEETATTVMRPSMDGGMEPVLKTQELRTRAANDTIESQTTTFIADGAGHWELGEIRNATVHLEANGRTSEERVWRRDAEGKLDPGKLGEVSRTVVKESNGASGEKRETVETYSTDFPGVARTEKLHLVEITTTTQRTSSTGEQVYQSQIAQPEPFDLDSNFRIYVLTTGKVVPGPSGTNATETIEMRDMNGNLGVVSVDMTNSDKVPVIQIEQTK